MKKPVKNKVKKNKFILINSVIIFFMAAFFAYAVEVKSVPASSNSVKAVPATTNVPVKQVPPASAATNTTVQGKTQPQTAAANVPVQNQAQPAPAATAAPDQNKTPPVTTSTSGDNYKYDPLNKPDPFQPFIAAETIEKKKAEKKVAAATSIFPLQRADTESYRVVGIAGTEDHRVAIVEDAAKKFYPIIKGTRIGLYNGKVVEIMSDRVIVEEYEDKKARRVILKLRNN